MNPIPHGPASEAVWRNGRKFIWEYATHAADPCGHRRLRTNSNVVHAAGSASHALHRDPRRASVRISSVLKAKTAALVPKSRNHAAGGAPSKLK
jgi:hypothetical protein